MEHRPPWAARSPDPSPLTAAVFVARLLALALVTGGMLAGQRPPDPAVVGTAAGVYVVIGVALVAAAEGQRRWLPLAGSVADVALISLAIGLESGSPFPLWSLYPFALLDGARGGRRVLIVASLAAAAGYAAATAWTVSAFDPEQLWPAGVIGVSAVALFLLITHFAPVRMRTRAFEEAATIGRSLTSSLEIGDVAAAAAREARRLGGISGARVWRVNADATLSPLASDGSAAELTEQLIDADLVRRLGEQPGRPLAVPLDRGRTALAVALAPEGEPFAVMALGPVPAGRRGELTERVDAFAGWAAEMFERAQVHAALRETHRREVVLRETAAALAGTHRRENVIRSVVDGVEAALGRGARIVGADGLPVTAGVRHQAMPPDERPARITRDLHQGLVLEIGGDDRGLAEDERWADALVAIARESLRRCEEHQVLGERLRLLRDAVERLPAPAILLDPTGHAVVANGAFRSLRIDPPRVSPQESPLQLNAADRHFVVTSTDLPDGHRVTLLGDVTREREALQAKEDLIAMMGHELRTPLTSVLGYSRMMGRHLDVVRDQVQRLNEIIGGFVDASRLQDSRVTVQRSVLDPADLAHEAAERFRGSHEGRTLRLSVGPAPPVRGDRAWLGQVLDNLLSNAAKYSPASGTIELIVGHNEEGDALLGVHDEGEGIAPEHLPMLFERHYRVSAGGMVQGQGLGLSIVRDLVTAHNGHVWAESPGPGQGSTFWFSLPPASPEDSEPASEPLTLPPAPEPATRGRGETRGSTA